MERIEFSYNWDTFDLNEIWKVHQNDGLLLSRKGRIVLILFQLFAFYLIFSQGPNWLFDDFYGYTLGVQQTVWLIICFAIVFILTQNIVWYYFKKTHLKSIFRGQVNESTQTVTATENEFTIESVNAKRIFKWNTFIDMRKSKNFGHLKLSKGSFIVIPKSVFGSEEEFDLAWKQIAAWMGRHND